MHIKDCYFPDFYCFYFLPSILQILPVYNWKSTVNALKHIIKHLKDELQATSWLDGKAFQKWTTESDSTFIRPSLSHARDANSDLLLCVLLLHHHLLFRASFLLPSLVVTHAANYVFPAGTAYVKRAFGHRGVPFTVRGKTLCLEKPSLCVCVKVCV